MEYKSLYEYLGRAAGSQLGMEVATAAKLCGVSTTTHHVSNSKYTGDIVRYPVDFLNLYFKK